MTVAANELPFNELLEEAGLPHSPFYLNRVGKVVGIRDSAPAKWTGLLVTGIWPGSHPSPWILLFVSQEHHWKHGKVRHLKHDSNGWTAVTDLGGDVPIEVTFP